jgi:hypothetical protein
LPDLREQSAEELKYKLGRAWFGGVNSTTVARNIRFFVLKCEKRESDGRWTTVAPSALAAGINQLPLTSPVAGRYLVEPEGDAVAAIIDHATDDRVEGKFAKLRRTALPLVERAGSLRPLQIRTGEGLFEPCHFVLFGGLILGYEGNFYGPRPGYFARYMHDKMPGIVDRASLESILRSDWEERLQQVGMVKLLRIRLARNMERQVRMLDESLASAFRAAARAAEAEEIELVLEGHPYSRSRFNLQWLANIRRFLRNEEARAGTTKFILEAENSQTEEMEKFDLLQEALVFTRPVRVSQDGPSRTIVSASAYEAIREAYREAEPELGRFKEESTRS